MVTVGRERSREARGVRPRVGGRDELRGSLELGATTNSSDRDSTTGADDVEEASDPEDPRRFPGRTATSGCSSHHEALTPGESLSLDSSTPSICTRSAAGGGALVDEGHDEHDTTLDST